MTEKPWAKKEVNPLGQVYIEELGRYEGQEVIIKGWVYNKRSSGKIQFILVRDGTGIVQGVLVKNEVSPEVFDLAPLLLLLASRFFSGPFCSFELATPPLVSPALKH